jgi:hypothetical protein
MCINAREIGTRESVEQDLNPGVSRVEIANGYSLVGVRGFEPPTAGTQTEPAPGPWWTKSGNVPDLNDSLGAGGVLARAVSSSLSDHHVRSELPLGVHAQLRALLSRALDALPDPSTARALVLDALRLLEQSTEGDSLATSQAG